MSTKDTPTTIVVNSHSGTLPLGDWYQKSQKRAHKVMSAYLIRVSMPITFPSGRHRREVTTIARVKASRKANVAALKKFGLAAL